jgi:hypothetical protein
MTYNRKTFNEIKWVIKARPKNNSGQPYSFLKEFRYEKAAKKHLTKLIAENPEYEIVVEQLPNIV